MPCSGPRSRPAASSASACRARSRARSAVTVMNALSVGLSRSMRAMAAVVSSTAEKRRARSARGSFADGHSLSSIGAQAGCRLHIGRQVVSPAGGRLLPGARAAARCGPARARGDRGRWPSRWLSSLSSHFYDSGSSGRGARGPVRAGQNDQGGHETPQQDGDGVAGRCSTRAPASPAAGRDQQVHVFQRFQRPGPPDGHRRHAAPARSCGWAAASRPETAPESKSAARPA